MESSCIFKADYEKYIQKFFKNFWKFIKLFFHFFLNLYERMENQLRNFPCSTIALASHCALSSRYYSGMTSKFLTLKGLFKCVYIQSHPHGSTCSDSMMVCSMWSRFSGHGSIPRKGNNFGRKF